METLTEKLRRIECAKKKEYGAKWAEKSCKEKNLLIWDAWHKEWRREKNFARILLVTQIAGIAFLAGVLMWAAETPEGTEPEQAAKEGYAVQALAPERTADIPWHVIEGVTVYHYCACTQCCGKTVDNPAYGITRSGTVATAGRTIAVDPDIIPLGAEVVIDGKTYIAEDTGGAIKGYTVDIYCESHREALEKGMRQATIKWREEAKK